MTSDTPDVMKLLSSLLESKFGFHSFRPHQAEVCRSVTEGQDALLVMPTGAGKSLCFQLPGLARGGTTIVISPLVALIEDQVAKLNQMGLVADRIHSGRKREDLRQACVQYLFGKLNFLFIAPERFRVPGFIEMLKKKLPSLVAVDEAHCISQWGHDFRPDYRLLGERVQELRPASVIALTATATPLVQDDICKQLGLKNELRYIHGFRRKNIAIQVVELNPSSRPSAVSAILKERGRLPAIIYVPTRKVAEALYEELRPTLKLGIYHAGMEQEKRDRNQSLFLEGKLDAIVATVAFGMGIDKANIRTVIHTALPGSIESYYQEIGRAGRDEQSSQAILLQSYSDQRTHDFFLERDYPELSVLKEIYKVLTLEKTSKAVIKEKLKSIGEDIFTKALEKLGTHRGAKIDFNGDVTLGTKDWENPYQEQRKYKQKQSLQVLAFAQSSRCRMLSLIKHFGDQKDNGNSCGICDFCVPSQVRAFNSSRLLSIKEQKIVAQIMATLNSSRSMAVGRIFNEMKDENPKLERSQFEDLLRILARARWIDISEDTFKKDGELIHFRSISQTSLGKKVKAKDLSRLQTFAQSEPGRKKKSNLRRISAPHFRPT